MKKEFKEHQTVLQLTNGKLATFFKVTERTIERWRSPSNSDEPPLSVIFVMRSLVNGKKVSLKWT